MVIRVIFQNDGQAIEGSKRGVYTLYMSTENPEDQRTQRLKEDGYTLLFRKP